MKKVLEITLAPNDSGVLFSLDGRRISNDGAVRLIERGCIAYLMKEREGVLVYMPKSAYEELEKQKRV